MKQHGLGRIPSVPHPRMAAFNASTILPAKPPRSYTWRCRAWLDQGSTSQCVGYSAAHEIAARPVERIATPGIAETLYRYAQEHDYWPGTNYEGSSVDGGMQALREHGYIRSWWWARTPEEVLMSIGYAGPVVFGMDWTSGMFTPDQDGFIAPTGSDAGGHAILATQVRLRWRPGTTAEQKRATGWLDHLDHGETFVGLHNSWGADWQPRVNGQPVPVKVRLADLLEILERAETAVPSQRIPEPRG